MCCYQSNELTWVDLPACSTKFSSKRIPNHFVKFIRKTELPMNHAHGVIYPLQSIQRIHPQASSQRRSRSRSRIGLKPTCGREVAR